MIIYLTRSTLRVTFLDILKFALPTFMHIYFIQTFFIVIFKY